VSRKQQTLDESKAAILKDTPETQVITIPADVADPKQAQQTVKKIVETFGRLDILVANAGFAPPWEHRE
jgi:short-subunit dehydrogenase